MPVTHLFECSECESQEKVPRGAARIKKPCTDCEGVTTWERLRRLIECPECGMSDFGIKKDIVVCSYCGSRCGEVDWYGPAKL